MDNWREPYDAKVSRTVLTGGMRKQALALRLVPTHSCEGIVSIHIVCERDRTDRINRGRQPEEEGQEILPHIDPIELEEEKEINVKDIPF
jgi:hypothetical protein